MIALIVFQVKSPNEDTLCRLNRVDPKKGSKPNCLQWLLSNQVQFILLLAKIFCCSWEEQCQSAQEPY
jgi:hypothetical protein